MTKVINMGWVRPTRRQFLQGLLGVAAATVAPAQAKILLPKADLIELPRVVPLLVPNSRWAVIAPTYRESVYSFTWMRAALTRHADAGGQGEWAARASGTPKITYRDTELWFFHGTSPRDWGMLNGLELTGAYFTDLSRTAPEFYSAVMSRTQRWPHRRSLPADFDWSTVNNQLADYLKDYTAGTELLTKGFNQ